MPSQGQPMHKQNEHPTPPLKMLWNLYAGDHGKLLLVAMLYVIKHSPIYAMPILIAAIFNVMVSGGELYWAWVYGGVLVGLILLNIPSHTLYQHVLSKTVRTVELRLRRRLIRRMEQLSISVHEDFSSGRLQSKMIRDVEAIQMLSFQFANMFMAGLIIVTVALIVTLLRQPRLTLLFAVAAPLGAVLVVSVLALLCGCSGRKSAAGTNASAGKWSR